MQKMNFCQKIQDFQFQVGGVTPTNVVIINDRDQLLASARQLHRLCFAQNQNPTLTRDLTVSSANYCHFPLFQLFPNVSWFSMKTQIITNEIDLSLFSFEPA